MPALRGSARGRNGHRLQAHALRGCWCLRTWIRGGVPSAGDARYPCPGTSAIADILLLVAALAGCAADTVISNHKRTWHYRSVRLLDAETDAAFKLPIRHGCALHEHSAELLTLDSFSIESQHARYGSMTSTGAGRH